MSGQPFSTARRRERMFTCGVLLPEQPTESDGALSEIRALVEAKMTSHSSASVRMGSSPATVAFWLACSA